MTIYQFQTPLFGTRRIVVTNFPLTIDQQAVLTELVNDDNNYRDENRWKIVETSHGVATNEISGNA